MTKTSAGSTSGRHELAPAKVNLYLHVTGRRSDGYHLIESLFVFAGAGDRLQVMPAGGLRLDVTGRYAPDTPAGNGNLVLRAAAALAALMSERKGARISLQKNLPVAAGLGGGSADAAAALRLLTKAWAFDPGAERLHKLALSLGADVPACLDNRPKLVSGIGDDYRPLVAPPRLDLVLVNPGVALPTAAVFAEFVRRGDSFTEPLEVAPRELGANRLVEFLSAQQNSLEAAAKMLRPEIAAVIAAIRGEPGCRLARMSGSGATCFGIFADGTAAKAAASAITIAHPGWWVWSGPLSGED